MEYFCIITMTNTIQDGSRQIIRQSTITAIATADEDITSKELYEWMMNRCEKMKPDLAGGVVTFYSAMPNKLV